MLRTSLQLGLVHGEDQLYIPVKARKNHNQRRQQHQKAKGDATENTAFSAKSKTAISEERNPQASSNSIAKPFSESSPAPSNLDRFLKSTTPWVPALYFSKTTMRGWRTCDIEFQHYFTLGDLWESFMEWSAYGAGVPLVLDGSDPVVQYYVPYLSGIQLYVESTTSNVKSRQAGEDSDGDYYRDSSSDGSNDYEFEKGMKFSRDQQACRRPGSDVPLRMGRLSIYEKHSTIQEGFSSDDSEGSNSHGHLLFEFFEHNPPHGREPLADKIQDLARRYPKLKTLRSCDLLPVSWMSVAWYPIYRIPMGQTLRDLDACFLTYHSLSTTMKDNGSTQVAVSVDPSDMEAVPKTSLPVFGMASYKFKASMWLQNGTCEQHQQVNSLMKKADSWLRLLEVNHPDFRFFVSHGMYGR